jgi:hypothetical protein
MNEEYEEIYMRTILKERRLVRLQELARMNDVVGSVCGYNLYAIPEANHQNAHLHLRKGEGEKSYASFDFKGRVLAQGDLGQSKTSEIVSWIRSNHAEIIRNWRTKVIGQNPK